MTAWRVPARWRKQAPRQRAHPVSTSCDVRQTMQGSLEPTKGRVSDAGTRGDARCCRSTRARARHTRLARFLPHELEERHGRAQKGGWARHSPLTSPLTSAVILCFFSRAFCLPLPLFIDAAHDSYHTIARETCTAARAHLIAQSQAHTKISRNSFVLVS